MLKLRLFLITLCLLYGCNTIPSHNKEGGYIEACGNLPPLVGDDC
jgi:hypothetical protein